MKLLSSTALVVGFGLIQANKLGRSGEERSIAEEKVQLLLSITEQQEQLASLQTQAEISNNVSSLATLNVHTSQIVQSWCDASLATEKDRMPRLGKLIDSNVPDLEREAAREARASEQAYSKLVASACKIQQHEIGHGLGQDLAAIQLRSDATVKEALNREATRKSTAATQKKVAVAKAGNSGQAASFEDDKAFESYMASMESASDARHDEDAKEETSEKKDVETENAKGDEAEVEEEEDDAAKKPRQDAPVPSHATETAEKPAEAVVAAAKVKKAAGAKVQAKDDDDDNDDEQDQSDDQALSAKEAITSKSKGPTSFFQLTNRHMLQQMSLNQMLNFVRNQPSVKQAKKWCKLFEPQGDKKTPLAPLKNARKSLEAEKAKLEGMKVLQLGQMKESKFRSRFTRFWKADTKGLRSLLQELHSASQDWAGNLHSVSDQKAIDAIEAARARFGKTSSALETALAARQQSIEDQEMKVSALEVSVAGFGDRSEKQLLVIKKAESTLEKVQSQISNIAEACAEMKRQGPALLLKGIPL